MNKSTLWKILYGEMTLPESLRYFGTLDGEVESVINEISSAASFDSTNYFACCLSLSRRAYDELVKINEIKGDEIFNLRSKSFSEENFSGDIGFCKDKTYRFSGSEWVAI